MKLLPASDSAFTWLKTYKETGKDYVEHKGEHNKQLYMESYIQIGEK